MFAECIPFVTFGAINEGTLIQEKRKQVVHELSTAHICDVIEINDTTYYPIIWDKNNIRFIMIHASSTSPYVIINALEKYNDPKKHTVMFLCNYMGPMNVSDFTDMKYNIYNEKTLYTKNILHIVNMTQGNIQSSLENHIFKTKIGNQMLMSDMFYLFYTNEIASP